MKLLWCWRCRMEIPMLDEEEFKAANDLYAEGIRNTRHLNYTSRDERFQPMLDYYFKLTGFPETNKNAVLHHRIALYGSPCESCGKPYRTPLAAFCAACGHRRSLKPVE